MSSTFMKSPSARVISTALGLLLGLSACSRSPELTAPVSGAGKPVHNTRDIPVNCPNMIPNTPATAAEYVVISAMCASFTTRRVRFEMFGDLPSPSVENMGPCVASDTPTIRFTSGHANVFVHGTTTSITETGQQLSFGQLLFPGALLEKGVVVANDAAGNVLEVIWPAIAGTGIGPPIVRVQLARWNLTLLQTSQTYDVVWDMVAERDGVSMSFKGRAERINLSGSPVSQAGAGSPGVCPQTLAGTSDSVVTQFANIVQFRLNRLRLEVIGDVPTGTIEASGLCAASETNTIQFLGGAANMFRAGTTQSVTFGHQELAFGPLVFPGFALEAGVVVAQDVSQNVLEIIWPGLAGLGVGPPILRLQLAHWDPWVTTGREVDAMMRFDAVGPDGITGSYVVRARNVPVPVVK